MRKFIDPSGIFPTHAPPQVAHPRYAFVLLNSLKVHEECEVKLRTASKTSGCVELQVPDIETTTPQGWSSRRRQRGAPLFSVQSWVGMGLPRHDGEVESVVVEDDAVLVLSVVAAHAMLKRMSQNDEATIASGLAVATCGTCRPAWLRRSH